MTTAANLGVQAAARFGDVNNNVVSVAQWLAYCNQAYNRVNALSPWWPWLETVEATVVVPDTGTVGAVNNRSASLPTDVLSLNWAYDVTDDYRLIDQMGRGDFFHQDHLRSEVGQPVTYRVRGSKIELNPTPSVATTVAFEAVTYPVALAGTDAPVFPSPFHDVLIDGMVAAAYLDDGNTAQATVYEGRFDARMAAMRNSVLANRTENNQIIRDTFWS